MPRINSQDIQRPIARFFGTLTKTMALGLALGLSSSLAWAAAPITIADKSEQRKLYDQAQKALSASRY
ncbi:hypothetical protein, partial [Gilvimarinus sp. 1_MG-2023]|uniref:hypothetical protein n=1 Tax=Gilvimarinus sp. 1_MG-2023 TaxID=3062638 RepID=UPI0026E2EED1